MKVREKSETKILLLLFQVTAGAKPEQRKHAELKRSANNLAAEMMVPPVPRPHLRPQPETALRHHSRTCHRQLKPLAAFDPRTVLSARSAQRPLTRIRPRSAPTAPSSSGGFITRREEIGRSSSRVPPRPVRRTAPPSPQRIVRQ